MILYFCKLAYQHLLKHDPETASQIAQDVKDDSEMPYEMIASKHFALNWLTALDFIRAMLAACYLYNNSKPIPK